MKPEFRRSEGGEREWVHFKQSTCRNPFLAEGGMNVLIHQAEHNFLLPAHPTAVGLELLSLHPFLHYICAWAENPAIRQVSASGPLWAPSLLLLLLLAVTFLPVCLAGSPSLRAYPLLSVITRQPTVISHLVPTTPGITPVLSRHPATKAATVEAPGGEALASSESETEQPTPRQKKPRRSRTIFTELQLMGLEKKFQKQKYLSTPDR